MDIALAQINTTVGDLFGNAQKIVAAAKAAYEKKAVLLLTPELSLTGHFPKDLLLSVDFLQKTQDALASLVKDLAPFKGLHVLVGYPAIEDGKCYNAVCVLLEGKILKVAYKRHLNDFFNESHYFEAAKDITTFTIENQSFSIHIGPDNVCETNADVLLVLSALPYQIGSKRADLFNDIEKPVIFTNTIGGQDDLVYDGNSFVRVGKNSLNAKHCEEDLLIFNLNHVQESPTHLSFEEELYQVLVLGTRDYVLKNNFKGAILGLSGGVDSALVLAIACDALGPQNVRVAMMPSNYTASISTEDAIQMAKDLGVHYDVLPIVPCFEAFRETLASPFQGLKEDVTEENLQARVRGTLLMALSNKTGGLVLTTGNKSEAAVGYCTLYGDMAGGFAVICDISKTLVYRLCRYKNQITPTIPERILTRAPSAELRPNQKDQDTLPPYDLLDGILERFVEENQSPQEIIAAGFDEKTVLRVISMVRLNEYKRKQAPVGISVAKRGFARKWHYPLTTKYRA